MSSIDFPLANTVVPEYKSVPANLLGIDAIGWFSAAYGAYRRFKSNGGHAEETNINSRKVAAHITLFNSDVALNKSIDWLRDLDYRVSKGQNDVSRASFTLNNIVNFINKSDLLPKGSLIEDINPDGVFIKDANQVVISLTEMSDGYRSMLSMLLDLIRQMSINSGKELAFKKNKTTGKIQLSLSGVVMIDEIDIHFHPNWQARIGHWFTTFFPNIQFIVTTHSPIICQSAANGSIWQIRMTEKGSEALKIEGQDFKRLVYGNVIEAMGTDVFGKETAQSEDAQVLLERLAKLNVKSMMKGLSEQEQEELDGLKSTLPTEAYSVKPI